MTEHAELAWRDLADVTIDFLTPFQERVRSISDAELDRVLATGCERARKIARPTLDAAKVCMGLQGARTAVNA